VTPEQEELWLWRGVCVAISFSSGIAVYGAIHSLCKGQPGTAAVFFLLAVPVLALILKRF
jgi:hypothetical protein